ncbi:MAG: NUDIX domain-containing protein [Planctomycetes bacterium]|nr:NUDIX domain-containing protein [Planctomycetota bacterium]
MNRTNVLHDDVVHSSYVFDVHRTGLMLPSGERVTRDVVRTRGAALVLPVLDDGRIVMIRQYRFAHNEVMWELPCGGLEDGESPKACAVRELREEAGYTAGHVEPLGKCYSTPGFTDEIIHNYLATNLADGQQDLDEHEDIEVACLEDPKVRQLVVDGNVVDAKTICALTTYWLRKGLR